MTKISLSCPECEADFKISYDMESRIYNPRFCAFCGEEIVDDDLIDPCSYTKNDWDEEEM